MSIYIKEPNEKPVACIIWMHGLGADAQDMMGIADALLITAPVTHIFINAPIRPVTINNNMPMRAWYNISGAKLTDREDKDGILESEKIINDAVDEQIANGFNPKQIFLAGFSQGGAMALFTGIRSSKNLGGIISLSAYLPLNEEITNIHNNDIPILLAMGEYDQIVLPTWTKKTYDWLNNNSLVNLTLEKYPMEHSICLEEITDISNWLNTILTIKEKI